MKRRLRACVTRLGLFVCLLCSLPSAGAQENATVRGEIVDLSCYMLAGGRGTEYEGCARLGSQRKGISIGVVTDAGELLLLVNQSADRDPYEAAKQLTGARAELTGRAVQKNGVASLIVESAERR
jgi:hypothetical protein